jgi:hypothetical protein
MKQTNSALRPRAWIAAIALMYASAGLAPAIVVIEEDETEFMAQVQPGYYLEDFETGFGGGGQGNSIPLSENGFSYVISSAQGLFLNLLEFKFTRWISNLDLHEPITITFSGAPVTALGGNFFLTLATEEATAGSFILELNDGTQYTVNSQPQSASSQPFVGFISSEPITSLTLMPPADFGDYVTLDNLIVGAAIPEPVGTTVAVAAGLLGLGLWRWRRAARARRTSLLHP